MAYTTKKSLLEAIRSNNEISWQEFYDTYRPFISFCADQEGFSAEDREDFVQTVMLKIFKSQSSFKYDESQGRFRNYLGAVIRHTIADYYRGSRRRPEVISAHNVPGSADDFDDRWLAEWQKHILEQSLIILRSTVHEGTFQAFQLTALEQRPPAEVAAFLQISVQNVYEAKSRCMEQLRKIVRDLSEKY